MTELALSRIHFPVTMLGPGMRIGIWFQGCSIRCSGCISLDTWASERGITSVEAVFQTMQPFLPHADGLTVSGGEPFDQPLALVRFLLLGGVATQATCWFILAMRLSVLFRSLGDLRV